MARVLIAGCGYVGAALAARLTQDSHDVWGLRRRTAAMPVGVRPVVADLAVARSLRGLPTDLDTIFYMASPGGPDDALYRTAYVEGVRNLLDALDDQRQKPGRLVFVSSTGVYGQTDGSWVDEESPTQPQADAGKRVLQGEEIARAAAFPAIVVRFGGIYGPQRTRLLERIRGGSAAYRDDPPQYTNRIHRDDCVGALMHLMDLEEPQPVYLGVDSEPAEERVVLSWIAGAVGAPAPRPIPPSAKAADRPRGNKRCRNARLLESGYALGYRTFRDGYRALIAAG